jgi:predicted nucleic acid-binding protein
MPYLLDTGILLRLFDHRAEIRPLVIRAVFQLLDRRVNLFVAVQNVAEFWNVSTRPQQFNGLGATLFDVEKRLRRIENIARVVPETDESYAIWKRLVLDNSVSGVQVHDARLVSVMMARGISHVLTLNERDFRRYSQIVAVTPSEVLAG